MAFTTGLLPRLSQGSGSGMRLQLMVVTWLWLASLCQPTAVMPGLAKTLHISLPRDPSCADTAITLRPPPSS
ncbi:hypothetical protein EDC04DRAFT_2686746 [Pisolithus marmoratus]|nr:hypothetical protein EDC04DRAFT_2686746 [Pisolithus marmoratus]